MGPLTQSDFKNDSEKGLKIIGGENTVIHCHHYNSRIQNTIESNKSIDGPKIIREAAALVYGKLFNELKNQKTDCDPKVLAADLYRFLGLGIVHLSEIEKGRVTAPFSHYVEGWLCGSIKSEGTVCRVTEGYLEGIYYYIYDKKVTIREIACANSEDHSFCEFEIKLNETNDYNFKESLNKDHEITYNGEKNEIKSNIDKSTIIDAVINMPIEGNEQGLIPAFNVYLAHTPQEFYNRISINFILEMEKVGLGDVAKEMLIEDAEICAMNTFGGIKGSAEWDGLVRPMIKEKDDEIFGLVAVANALGWGRIDIVKHTAYEELELCSYNGYEAYGYLELKGLSKNPQCFMLRGITAGLMALIYEKGNYEDRSGRYISEELTCLTKKDQNCHFRSEIDK